VVILQVHDSDIARFTGTVHARTQSDLGFRVGGKIIQKLVDEGTTVKRPLHNGCNI
jgi:multidrug efflux pump subunit AcrA (membrane-fusion protein)